MVAMTRSQRMRKTSSWILVSGMLVFLLISSNYWEEQGLETTLFFLLGMILVGIATIGRVWCSLYISGYKTNTLVTAGPYSMCRNPLYFFSFLGVIGAGMCTETLVVPILAGTGFLFYYPSVIAAEEAGLESIHGDDYRRYRERTPRFLPSPSLLAEPLDYKVDPVVFRKRIFDALWFVWIVGILELIEALHESGLLPTFLRLF